MADTSNSYHVNFLKKVALFSGLDNEYIKYFLEAAKVRVYDKGEILCMIGQPADKFYIVLDGWVKLYRETVEGEESVTAICTKGDSFSKAILFEAATHPANAEVIESATIFEIPANIIRDKIKSDNKLAYNMLTSMANSINRLGMQIEHLASMNTAQRLGCFLLKLCETQNTMDKCRLPYDKTVVANYLGMKPETFSRSLNKLKPVGVTVKSNDVTIKDINALKEFCCISCSSTDECNAAKRACCSHSCVDQKVSGSSSPCC